MSTLHLGTSGAAGSGAGAGAGVARAAAGRPTLTGTTATAAARPSGARGPRTIHKLDPVVVNRIAAGEVVHRPASALKEMIENSLDAGSTAITVTVKGGGLKLLQIKDNGSGIKKESMDIVCERFTTSKLVKFDDLETISTYGFRGEALASITHVAHVTITTMTADSPCAYRACYSDGKLVAPAPGQPATPKPCAGVKGTIITVEDMFYNVDTRRRALRSASDEYQRILDVVTRYAIHYGSRGVSFTCKKHGTSSSDVHTLARASVTDNIGALYGRALARELLPIKCSAGYDADVGAGAGAGAGSGAPDMSVKFKVEGLVSNANYSMKKSVFIVFINDRLVDCGVLKRAVEAIFSDYLPKRTHPFVYIALTMPGPHVDVNVHPTKREVHFLHEDEVVEAVQTAVQECLQGANTSRNFYQAVLPTSAMPTRSSSGLKIRAAHRNAQATTKSLIPAADARPSRASTPREGVDGATPRLAPNRTVRTDATAGSLDTFVTVRQRATGHKRSRPAASERGDPDTTTIDEAGAGGGGGGSGSSGGGDRHSSAERAARQPADHPRSDSEIDSEAVRVAYRPRRKRAVKPVLLTSVQNMLADVEADRHDALQRVIKNHVFVGVADHDMTLIQHDTKLLLTNHVALCRALFYQLAVRFFANLESFSLSPPPLISELAAIALEEQDIDGDPATEAKEVAELLKGVAPMLKEYFGIGLIDTAEGQRLQQLPLLLDNYTPLVAALPDFVLELAWKVNWNEEQPCFEGVATALANYYSTLPLLPEVPPFNPDDPAAQRAADKAEDAQRRSPGSLHYITRNILFPAMRDYLTPPKSLADDHEVLQVACTEQLYKIFERC